MWRVPALLTGALCAASLGDHDDGLSLLQVAHRVSPSVQKPHWSGKNGDLMRTASSPFTVASDLSGGPTWSFHESGNGLVRTAPVIDASRNIYLATISGSVYKFTPEGKQLWSYTDHASIPDVPALLDGSLFVTTDKGVTIALDAETGKELWRSRVGPRSAGDTWSMTAGEGVVVAATSDNGKDNNCLVGLDAKTGAIKWRFKADHTVYNVLCAIKDGALIFSDQTGAPYRLNLQDGTVFWKKAPSTEPLKAGFSTGGAIIGTNNVVYVTSNEKTPKGNRGRVTAFRFEDGAMLWRQDMEYEANNAAAFGRLSEGGPLALVVGVGENPDFPDPMLQLVGVKQGLKEKKARVVALDAATGSRIWSHELPRWHGWAAGDTVLPTHICLPDSFGNPAIGGDGTAYVGFESGHLFAIRDKDGNGQIEDSEASTFNFENAFQGSPGIAPGMLVATPCNGMHVWLTASA